LISSVSLVRQLYDDGISTAAAVLEVRGMAAIFSCRRRESTTGYPELFTANSLCGQKAGFMMLFDVQRFIENWFMAPGSTPFLIGH
jgi:hypothetical protein